MLTENTGKYSPEFLTPHNVLTESREMRQKLPPMSPWYYGWKYVDELNRFQAGDIPAPSQTMIDELWAKIILNFIRNYGAPICAFQSYRLPDGVEATLNAALELAANNPAVYDFFMSTDQTACRGVKKVTGATIKEPSVFASEFFIPWRVNSVPRAECLEFAYGFAIDWFGRLRKIPETDLSYYLAFMDPLFGGIVDRGAKVVEWLNREKPEKIIFAPAGLAPEFRHLGLTLDERQTAVLIDRDPTIEYDEILVGLPFKNQITTIQGDLLEALHDSRCLGADALVCTGFLTYCWDKLPAIIGLFRKVLRPGGTLIIDASADHWVVPRNKAVSFYLPMTTFRAGAEAEASLLRALARNSIPGCTLERYTCHDTESRPTEFVFRVKMPS
ncbi:class I SAM-dependent methyltransferase [Candidatus Saccharibacteria bacterium]|nr:class I SAM-dependent methyltransferase [Candidatus Saccharibacteria bacterium]